MSFRLIYELSIPREPNVKKILTQIEIFRPVADSFLVPDNHLGRAAMSSLAAAIEVRANDGKPLVALNARDRNELRLKSDLLTLTAYEIDEVLFVYGDPAGERSGLTVRRMLEASDGEDLKRGVAVTIGKPLGWRERADFLFTNLAFGRGKPGYWREARGFSHPLYCGVIALQNRDLSAKYLANIPGLEAPPGYLEAFDDDGDAGFRAALKELDDLKAAGVDGAHLVVPAGWRRFAGMLEEWVGGAA